MAKLSYLKKLVDSYLTAKGDKEIISIGSCHGGNDEYILNLADIYDGPIGSNPYSGKDEIALKRDDGKEAANVLQTEADKARKAYFDLKKELCQYEGKTVQSRLMVAWGALSVMHIAGFISRNKMRELWTELALELMGLS